MHICQISKDISLLNWDETCEPVQRQVSYVTYLKEKHPEAQMTIVVLHYGHFREAFVKDAIRILPVKNNFYNRVFKVFFVLKKLNNAQPVNMITSQNPYDEAWPALIFSKLYNIPSIAQIHMDIFNKEAVHDSLGNSFIGSIRLFTFKRLIRYFTAIRVVGSRIKKDLIHQNLADPKRIFVLPVTVPLVGTKINDKEVCDSNRPLSILFVGRLVPQKNLFFWLDIAKEIIKQLPAVSFDIVGDGYLKSELQQYADKSGIANSVHFHGEVRNDLLKDYYSKADIFLMTSNYEGFGRVILEAGVFGLPVISTNITGPEDIIISGYNGYLFETGDKEGFVNCIVELFNKPQKRIELGRNNQKHVIDKFQPAKLKQEWVDLWVRVLPNLPPSMKMIRKRTLSKWKKIWTSKSSLWRTLTYEIVEEIQLMGLTLDIGGGKKNSYHHLFKSKGQIETINIDPDVNPTYLFDLNKPIVLASEIYDTVISLNTFEHIYRDELAITEAIRLLKPGGCFHFFIPFLYKIHAEPHDYHRRTGFWWNNKLLELGLKQNNFQIDSLCWNKNSTIQSAGGRPLSLTMKLLLLFDVLKDSKINETRLKNIPKNALYLNYPLGYYIKGIK
ncbi:MAG: glycosyltransferase [Ferruginibacter sp.]